MTVALATFVVLILLAVAFGLPALRLIQLSIRLVVALAAVAYRAVSVMFVIGGYVVALILWGIWLCIDRRGALEAYRAHPRVAGLRG